MTAKPTMARAICRPRRLGNQCTSGYAWPQNILQRVAGGKSASRCEQALKENRVLACDISFTQTTLPFLNYALLQDVAVGKWVAGGVSIVASFSSLRFRQLSFFRCATRRVTVGAWGEL